MFALLDPFVRLCLLTRNPQDLPVSALLMKLTLAGYLLVSVLIETPTLGLGQSVVQSIIEVGILYGYTLLMLRLARRPERLTQTVSALAGSGILLSLVALPFAYLPDAMITGAPPGPTDYFYLGLMIWSLAVYGHIYRHALSGGMLAGFLASIGFVLFTSLITGLVFDLPAGA